MAGHHPGAPRQMCPDCDAGIDAEHHAGCDIARCLHTGLQRLSCYGDHDCGRDTWDGYWPGDLDAIALGYFSKWVEGHGWVSATIDDPGASPDINRLHKTCRWNREQQRWEPEGAPQP